MLRKTTSHVRQFTALCPATERTFVDALVQLYSRKHCTKSYSSLPDQGNRRICSKPVLNKSHAKRACGAVQRNSQSRSIRSSPASDKLHDISDGISGASSLIHPLDPVTRPRTFTGLPVRLTRSELASQIDPYPSQLREEDDQSHRTDMVHLTPKIVKRRWPTRLQEFIGTLPIRNYAHDFVLWDMTSEDIWERYQLLPEPRCLSISRTALQFVLSSLAKEKPRSRLGMSRYMSIIEEMKSQRPPIVPTVAEWSAAISFVGRSHKRPRSADLDHAMAIWEDMENDYGVKADRATFNILFDIALRARRWQTSEVLLSEMKSRRISMDRFTWTSQIQRAGYKQDGDEVRRTARLMVESGEIVDTYVLNCIMSALIRAGEPEEAEHLFERIKRLTLEAAKTAKDTEIEGPRTRETTNFLTSQYQQKARTNRALLRRGTPVKDIDSSPQFAIRSAYYLAPDIASFNMLLQHHCHTTGDFPRVTTLLEDMERFKIPDTAALFQSLFAGFAKHGGTDRTWSLARLEYIFGTLMKTSEVRISQDLARLALRAYGVVGEGRDVNAAWIKLDGRWQAGGGDPLRRSSNVMEEYSAALGVKAKASLSSSPTTTTTTPTSTTSTAVTKTSLQRSGTFPQHGSQ